MNPHFSHWSEAAARYRQRGEPYTLVTVLNVKGSTPRDSGTKMLVSADRCVGTIGGGHLEYLAIDRARELMQAGQQQQHIENFPLGARLGQCCGGHVTLLFEAFADAAVTVALFGAGHVGRALARILADLPVRLLWVDGRADEFPTDIPPGVHRVINDRPEDEVADLPSGAYVIVMTHQHPLDFAIVESVMRRGDSRYLGVIGSTTKSQRFRLRLRNRGFNEDQIATLHCPIGLSAVPGKQPMEVAVSVAAQLIAHYQSHTTRRHSRDSNQPAANQQERSQ